MTDPKSAVMDAVTVENVYKQYEAFKGISLKNLTRETFSMLRARAERRERTESRFVLSDISFSLKQGETLGLVGHNGSGKTTLLRLLAGVSLPTLGLVRVVGRVQPLLALGAGFHPELTGRQNLYLNCTLMGLDIDQTRARIDRIIEFAEIGDYVDVAIKRYSSGMLARLGFSAAINMSPDVILIDETMAVGDYAFNVKSTAAIRDYIARGTVVLVSHDMSIMERICQRVIWLDHGEIRADGNATSVIYQYTRDQQKRIIPMGDARGGVQPTVDPQQPFAGVDADNVLTRRQRMDENVLVHEVGVLNDAGERASIVTPGDPIQLFAEIEFIRPVPSVRVQIGVYDIDTRALITACDNQLIEALPAYSGRMRFVARFPELVLRPRNFGVRVAVWDPNGLIPMYLWTDISPRFAVEGERRSADLHYVAPQDDLVYSAGMTMRIEPQSQPAEPALSESTEMR